MKHIVKRKGHMEEFDAKKIYASVYAACMTLRMSDGESELLADTVLREVIEDIKDFKEISSSVIHKYVVERLKKYNSDVAFMYDTHRDIS